MPHDDPFLIEPELWYGVLCEEVRLDQHQRIDLVRVFNRVHLQSPPRSSGIQAFAHLQAMLVVGLSHGVGSFAASVRLENVDGHVLWERPQSWEFAVGPGDAPAAMLVEPLDYWFSEPGSFYYVVRLSPGSREFRIRFEVAPGPPPQLAASASGPPAP